MIGQARRALLGPHGAAWADRYRRALGSEAIAALAKVVTNQEQAAPDYAMSVAGNADPMLGYLTASFRDHPRLRQQMRRQMTSAMRERLQGLGVTIGAPSTRRSDTMARLYAAYARAGGDRRTSSLEDDGLPSPPTSRMDATKPGSHGWHRALDHSVTTAVCGIHPRGKPPQVASEEIAGIVEQMIALLRSGVALTNMPGGR